MLAAEKRQEFSRILDLPIQMFLDLGEFQQIDFSPLQVSFLDFPHIFIQNTLRDSHWLLSKGQLISKCLFWCHHLDQNSNEYSVKISALKFL